VCACVVWLEKHLVADSLNDLLISGVRCANRLVKPDAGGVCRDHAQGNVGRIDAHARGAGLEATGVCARLLGLEHCSHRAQEIVRRCKLKVPRPDQRIHRI